MTNTWWELNILSEPDLEDTIFWRLEKFGCRFMARTTCRIVPHLVSPI